MDATTSLTSWQSAFEDHPIPATRAILRELQGNIFRDKERLRTLVGNSYRPLLSTAHTITSLHDTTTSAESRIHSLSLRCKPPSAPPKSPGPSEAQRVLAQLRLTQHCLHATSKSLKHNSILLSAQLLVIIRLLLKSLSDSHSNLKILDPLRHKASTSRRNLIDLLDGLFSTPSTDEDQLTQAIVAYCLITSSSPQDSIKHFQACRTRVLREHAELPDTAEGKQSLEELRYLIHSLRMSKSLYGTRVSDELGKLQKQPILQNDAVKSMEMLELDKLLPLVPEDIQVFTPYVKRYVPSRDEVSENMAGWIVELCDVFVAELRQRLASATSLEEVLRSHREMLKLGLPEYFNFVGFAELVGAVRTTVNECVKTAIRRDVQGLKTIASTIGSGEAAGTQPKSLWQEQFIKSSADRGAMAFLAQVQSRHEGQTRQLRVLSKSLQHWTQVVEMHRSSIAAIREQRWQDSYEDAYDEDEEVATDLARQLSQDDPQLYNDTLQHSLKDEIDNLQDRLAKQVEGEGHDNARVTQAVYLLRVIRLSHKLLRPIAPEVDFDKMNAMVPKLHQTLAEAVAARLTKDMEHHATSAASISNSVLPENLPSPKAFQALRRLCLLLVDIGGHDLWSPAGIILVKNAVWSVASQQETRFLFTQNEFDEAYLRTALGQDVDDSGDSETDVPRRASEYWQRSRLLFGLL